MKLEYVQEHIIKIYINGFPFNDEWQNSESGFHHALNYMSMLKLENPDIPEDHFQIKIMLSGRYKEKS